MVHGTPDWGFGKIATVHVLSEDLAELAARLGSIHVYDRRGYVIWSDDFSQGMESWYELTDGAGASIGLTDTFPHWPPNCVRLIAGSTGSNKAEIRRYLGGIPKGVLGLEIKISFPTPFNMFTMMLSLVENNVWHHARIRLNYTEDKIYYRDESGVYQELGALPRVQHAGGMYHNLKVAADFSTDTYDRVLFNEASYDLSTYSLQSFRETASSQIRVFLQFLGREGENDYCLIDGVIVTQNE